MVDGDPNLLLTKYASPWILDHTRPEKVSDRHSPNLTFLSSPTRTRLPATCCSVLNETSSDHEMSRSMLPGMIARSPETWDKHASHHNGAKRPPPPMMVEDPHFFGNRLTLLS